MRHLILSIAALALSAHASSACLIRDPDPILNLTNIERPRENRILITSSNQNNCSVAQCKVSVGDVILIDEKSRSAIWKRKDGDRYELKFDEVSPPDGNKIWKSQVREGFVYYLLEHSAFLLCSENHFVDEDRDLDAQCRTFEFEAFFESDDDNAPYIKPDSERAKWVPSCTGETEPGSGGGSEPPPPPK
jgi:hypothetical protein